MILMPSLVISRSVSLIAAFGLVASPCTIFDLAAVDAAALVDHVAGDLHRFPVLDAVLGERPGQRQQHADADGFLGRRMTGCEKRQTRCNETCPETQPVTHIRSSPSDCSFYSRRNASNGCAMQQSHCSYATHTVFV